MRANEDSELTNDCVYDPLAALPPDDRPYAGDGMRKQSLVYVAGIGSTFGRRSPRIDSETLDGSRAASDSVRVFGMLDERKMAV